MRVVHVYNYMNFNQLCESYLPARMRPRIISESLSHLMKKIAKHNQIQQSSVFSAATTGCGHGQRIGCPALAYPGAAAWG